MAAQEGEHLEELLAASTTATSYDGTRCPVCRRGNDEAPPDLLDCLHAVCAACFLAARSRLANPKHARWPCPVCALPSHMPAPPVPDYLTFRLAVVMRANSSDPARRSVHAATRACRYAVVDCQSKPSKPTLESQIQNHAQKCRICMPLTVAYGVTVNLTLTLKGGFALTHPLQSSSARPMTVQGCRSDAPSTNELPQRKKPHTTAETVGTFCVQSVPWNIEPSLPLRTTRPQ